MNADNPEPPFGGSFENKRRSQRLLFGDRLCVEFRKAGIRSAYSRGYINDLSQNGISFTAMLALQEGTSLDLVLDCGAQFPGMPRVQLPAKVIRSHFGSGKFLHHVACSFEELAPADRRTLQAYLVRILEGQGPVAALETFWKVSALRHFQVEYQLNQVVHKGYGCELSPSTVFFVSMFAPPPNSRLKLTLFFPSEFPGAHALTLQAVVRESRKVEIPSPCFEIQCALEHTAGSSRQAIQTFLKWLVAHSAELS